MTPLRPYALPCQEHHSAQDRVLRKTGAPRRTYASRHLRETVCYHISDNRQRKYSGRNRALLGTRQFVLCNCTYYSEPSWSLLPPVARLARWCQKIGEHEFQHSVRHSPSSPPPGEAGMTNVSNRLPRRRTSAMVRSIGRWRWQIISPPRSGNG